MPSTLLPLTDEIRDAFEQEVTELGGSILETFAEGEQLLIRGVLPDAGDVTPGDTVHGGVALRTRGECVIVHPFTYRLVCRNGALMARTAGSRTIERRPIDTLAPSWETALLDIRLAVRAAASGEMTAESIAGLRRTTDIEADRIINALPMLLHVRPESRSRLIGAILGRYDGGGDRSAYGVLNAITALARDTADPDLKWRLEELGGGIPAGLEVDPAPDSGSHATSAGGVDCDFLRRSKQSVRIAHSTCG